MLKRGVFLLLCTFTGSVCFAQGLEINLGDQTAQLKYSTNAGGTTYGRSETTFGVLTNKDKDVDMGEIGLLVIDVAGSKAPGLEVGIGPKLYVVSTKCCDAAAIGLGGTLRYKPGLDRFYLAAKGFYAPSVVAFADAESMYEAAIEFGYEVLPTADIYVGARDIEVDFTGLPKGKVDDTAYFGMKINF